MKDTSLQSKITTNKFALPGTILVIIACWVLTYVLVPTLPDEEGVYSLWIALGLPHETSEWLSRLISLVLYFVTGYFLIALNNAYGIIRIRASVQTCFYFMFVVVCPAIHVLNPGDVSAFLFVVSVYFLFGSYQRPNSARYLFNAFVFAGLGSLLFPQITFLVLLLLFGAQALHALNIKSFMAALLGWSVPYWFLFTYSYLTDRMELFLIPFREMANIRPFMLDTLRPWELTTIGYFFLLFVVSAIHYFAISGREKIRNRLFLHYLMIQNLLVFALIFFQPGLCLNLLPLLFAGMSIQVAHLFIHSTGKVANTFIVCAVSGLVMLYGFNLWMLSSIS